MPEADLVYHTYLEGRLCVQTTLFCPATPQDYFGSLVVRSVLLYLHTQGPAGCLLPHIPPVSIRTRHIQTDRQDRAHTNILEITNAAEHSQCVHLADLLCPLASDRYNYNAKAYRFWIFDCRHDVIGMMQTAPGGIGCDTQG